jgi:hypothetical protein
MLHVAVVVQEEVRREAIAELEDEPMPGNTMTRQQLIELLNGDLSREYQAIIAYVVYSQVLKGAEYMTVAEELERHAKEELGMPTATPQPVKLSDDARIMLRADLKTKPRPCGIVGNACGSPPLRKG